MTDLNYVWCHPNAVLCQNNYSLGGHKGARRRAGAHWGEPYCNQCVT